MHELAKAIRPLSSISIEEGAATPQTISEILAETAWERSPQNPLAVFTGLVLERPAYLPAAETSRINITTPMPGRGLAGLGNKTRYLPIGYADCAKLFRDEVMSCESVAFSVTPKGTLGVQVGYWPDLIASVQKRNGTLLVEINEDMPDVPGAPLIDLTGAKIIRSRRALCLDPQRPAGDAERATAEHVATIIPDGACLQIGIGALGDAVIASLLRAGRRALSVHSGMLGNAMVDLALSGRTARATPLGDPPFHAGLLLGDTRLFAWAENNPQVKLGNTDTVHAIAVTSAITSLTCINFALQVDFAGNTNAEAIGTRRFSGAGGQLDFAMGACAAPKGRSIVAITSQTRKGASKIVPSLNGPTTTPGSRVHFVVTEHGAVDLRGKTSEERALTLISIAAPEHRSRLLEALE